MIATASEETDEQLVSRAVNELVRRSGFPVAFGGLERDGAIHVTSVVGNRTPSLEGLVVHAARGLGGRALVEHRPRLALDYRNSRSITHDYDSAVLGEGICTLFAAPVLVRGSARGVLYCGSWSRAPIGDSVARSAVGIADDLAIELQVRDEVRRRVAAIPPAQAALSPAAREELRECYAELRSIAASVEDPTVLARLAVLERRLAALSRGQERSEPPVHLSPREIDVLACAALGRTNAQIAMTLALRESTIKSYLQAALAKLNVSTRHAAVAKARRTGLLP